MGEVAVEQGRIEDSSQAFRSVESQENDIALGLSPSQRNATTVDDDQEQDGDDSPDSDDTHMAPSLRIDDAPKPGTYARRQTIGAAQTVPALPLHLRNMKRSRTSEDPLGQLDADHVTIPYLSSPSIPSARPSPRSATINRADALLDTYSEQAQTQLLRGHYCRSEVKFLLSLENICNRLVVIPKPARVSALRAELTALNHKLPAEVCMPMWCSSSDSATSKGYTQPHHRIVRIPPGESVVLNSAERAPYLLLIEVLNDDLDFAPTKRANKEVLKKIVMKEDERKGTSKDLIPFNDIRTARPQPGAPSTASGGDVVRTDSPRPWTPAAEIPATSTSAAFPADDEEIDLVEQLYGTDQSLRSRTADISDSIVLPPPPKNRELELAAWSRPSQFSSPLTADSASPSPRIPPPLSMNHSTTRVSNPPSATSPHTQSPSVVDGPQTLSLDDYSERMRTAAIMLAQLNANLVREQFTPAVQPGSSGNSQPPRSARRFSGLTSPDPSTSKSAPPVSDGMKLQHTEAAAIRDRIMKEMLALEEQRMERMREIREGEGTIRLDISGSMKSTEDEGIIRRELNKADPSAVVFSESWATKKVCQVLRMKFSKLRETLSNCRAESGTVHLTAI
ncbi:hypothetical protein DXG03_001841 [Asterophora parasitica]|uniref:Uncharacterized protein n=1 Tax=Asterophora parasitica TaxID=117018 RepID=A0A9P7KBD0_9AGAR|nr:hypothetical protein DXG03_001841 [Asterophora parasitica]